MEVDSGLDNSSKLKYEYGIDRVFVLERVIAAADQARATIAWFLQYSVKGDDRLRINSSAF